MQLKCFNKEKLDCIISIFVIILSVIIGFNGSYIAKYHIQMNQLVSLDQQIDSKRIIFNFSALENDDQPPSSYYNYLHNGVEESTINKIREIGYPCYPYIGFYINNSEKTNNKVFMSVEQHKCEIDINDPIVIVPYYPEDNLEQGKIYISTALLSLFDDSPINKELTIDNIEVPSWQEETTSIVNQYNGNTIIQSNVDCFEVKMENRTAKFFIDEAIEYHSYFYSTDYAILVPYDQILAIIAENEAGNLLDKYTIPNFVTYYPDEDNGIYISDIKNIDSKLCVFNLHNNIANQKLIYAKDMNPKKAYYSFGISILLTVILGLLLIDDFKEKILMIITLAIGAIITGYLHDTVLSLLELKIIIVSLLLALVIISLINLNEKRIYTGSLEACKSYMKEHHLEKGMIRKNNSRFRSFSQRDKADSFVYNNDSSQGWQDEYSVYIKRF